MASLTFDDLDDTQQDVVLDRQHHHRTHTQAAAFAVTPVPLQTRMDVGEFFGVVDVFDQDRTLAQRDITRQ